MVISMNAAIAGLKAHQTKMDVLSNNIANVNTWGYKSRTTNFQDSMYSNSINGSQGTGAPGTQGGINSSQLGYGSTVSSISTNFATGSGQYTGNALDCMVDGPGFFIVGPMRTGTIDPETDIQSSGLFLSRVGVFSPDANGYLVDGTGNYIYGFEKESVPVLDDNGDPVLDKEGNPVTELVAKTDTLVPIRIPIDPATVNPAIPGSGERYNITTWSIGTDGTIVGVNAENLPVTIGQLAVASVENPSGLEQSSGYLYTIGANAGNVVGMTTTSATGTIKSNYLEMSNVDLASDMATMITTQRGYQANTKIITVTDEMLEQLVNMKR